MIDTRLRLSVLHDDNGVFADRTEEAADFSRDAFSITLNASEDYLYVGYRKPFAAAYCELATANTNANTFTMEYYNGTTWAALEDTRDLTKGLTRSGWLGWTKPTTWAEVAVNSVTKYWVRLRCSVTHSATSVSGLNLVFADDYDLQLEFPSVLATGFLPSGETTHLKTHVAVRNELIQDLRNRGFVKFDVNDDVQNITPWDLLDIEEVRQAATCLALAKIFFNYSDDPADHWYAKYKHYEAKYQKNIDLLKASVDEDDDGITDDDERAPSRVVRVGR